MKEERSKILKQEDRDHEFYLAEFFKIIQMYEFKGYRIVFLTKRFYYIYLALLNKYDIEINDCELYDKNKGISKKKKVYINDISYELPKDIRCKDIMYTYGFVNEDIRKYQQILDNDKTKRNKFHKTYYIYNFMTIRNIFEFLSREMMYLKQYGVKDFYDLTPDFLINEFKFHDKYKEQIYFFEKEYKKFLLEKYFKEEVTVKDCYRFGTNTICKMIEIFGTKKMPDELVQFLLSYKDVYNLSGITEVMMKENNDLVRKRQID